MRKVEHVVETVAIQAHRFFTVLFSNGRLVGKGIKETGRTENIIFFGENGGQLRTSGCGFCILPRLSVNNGFVIKGIGLGTVGGIYFFKNINGFQFFAFAVKLKPFLIPLFYIACLCKGGYCKQQCQYSSRSFHY